MSLKSIPVYGRNAIPPLAKGGDLPTPVPAETGELMTMKQTERWVAVDMFTGEIITDSKASRILITHREIVSALAHICKMLPPMGGDGERDWSRMTKAERGILNRCAKQLREADAKIEQIEAFIGWWYKCDWRGAEKKQLPGPWDVIKNWSRFLNWLEGTDENPALSWLKALGFETLAEYNDYLEAKIKDSIRD